MTRRREWILIACVALTAAAAGYAYNAWRTAPEAGAPPEAGLARLHAARLPDLDGTPQALEQWRGKVVVVNFWATWCAPCREEIPLFVKLQKKYGERGLQFVGVAIDQPDKVRPFAAELGMNYPVLIGGADAIELTRALGNRAGVLPYTVIVDRDGKVRSREVGIAKEAKLDPLLASLL
jgi:thiol-disulfide isomerase/thioredoxin